VSGAGEGQAGSPVVAVVLAAGEGRRMGRPKATLVLAGETLVHRAARVALEAGCDAVVVVVGADAAASARALADLPVHVAPNPEHRSGLASSIRTGVRAAAGLEPRAHAVLVLPCDLPRVGASALAGLLRAHRERGADLVASAFDGVVGPPALFAGPHRDALLGLEGDRGARSLLEAAGPALHRVPCPEAALDLDTEADLRRLLAERRAPGGDGGAQG
jgi:molybdenum cofactor cytidylyltransferase